MGQCRYCGNKGFFLATDKNGLCTNCQSTVLFDVKQQSRIIDDCLRLIEQGKTAATRLSRCDVLLERAERLLQYEKRGIPTISPSPSTLIEMYRSRRDEIISEDIATTVQKALEKAAVVGSARAKVSALNAALLKIRDIGNGLRDPALLESHETNLRQAAHKAELEGYLDEARKAEFKGNLKRAIDQYKEALYFLKNDDVPDDSQQSEISEVEAKIKQLTDPEQTRPTDA